MSNHKLIAKNSIYLFIRMFISMGISLYTTRVILNALGVTDYGIYNTIAGFVALFSFLNSAMSGATSRFITYELEQREKNVQTVFSVALTIHLIIALCVLLCSETFGIWFIDNKLNIPENRLSDAHCLLQFSLITMFINFTQVPYTATIIAHEKMNIFAYVELLHSGLKLLLALLLPFFENNRLIWYGVMVMTVQGLIMLINRVYCVNKWNDCKLKLSLDNGYLRPMLKYCIWDLIGQGSLVARTQGVNMLLNVFWGPILNAASGIASQVQGAVFAFSNNIITAFRPQVVKSYSKHECNEMIKLLSLANILTTLLQVILVVPLVYEMNFILHLWLVDVPDYAVLFCKIMLLNSLFGHFSTVIMVGIDATARIKETSIILGIIYMSVVPVSYFLFRHGAEPYMAYIYNLLTPLVTTAVNMYWLHQYISEFSPIKYFRTVILRLLFIIAVSFSISYIVCYFMDEGWWRLTMITFTCSVVTLSTGYFIAFTKEQRMGIKDIVRSKLSLVFRHFSR